MATRIYNPWLYPTIRNMLRVSLTVWNRFTVKGQHFIPSKGGCILAANHVSFLDPPALGSAAKPRDVCFMARDSLFKPGFAEWFFHAVGTVPISRERGDVAALKRGLQLLRDGFCVGLFPEGTRSPDGTLQPAKGGIGFLISKAGVPVVPAYISGTYTAYPKGARFIKPHHVQVVFGEPITPKEIEGLGEGREAYEKAASLVMQRIALLRDAHLIGPQSASL